MTQLKLFIGNKNYSTWSLRAWLALKHTGLDFEEVKINLYTQGSKEKLAQHTPSGLVPALKHGDVAVWDSLAIIDYCARLAPDKFWWPDDNAAFAMARSMTAEMHSGFTALRTHASMNMRKKWRNLTIGDAVIREVERVESLWTQARRLNRSSGDFLFGAFSAADMMFAPVVSRFETYGMNVSDATRQYMQAVLAYPAMQEWTREALTETATIEAAEYPDDLTHIG